MMYKNLDLFIPINYQYTYSILSNAHWLNAGYWIPCKVKAIIFMVLRPFVL